MADSISNAQLALNLSNSLGKWNSFLDNLLTWETSPADGGDNSDGRYDLTRPDGSIVSVKGLIRLIEDVDALLNSAEGAKLSAEDAQRLAEDASSAALNASSLSESNRISAKDTLRLTEISRLASSNSEIICRTYRDQCVNARDLVVGASLGQGLINVLNADQLSNTFTEEHFSLNKLNIIHATIPNSYVILPSLSPSYLILLQDAVLGGGNITFSQEA